MAQGLNQGYIMKRLDKIMGFLCSNGYYGVIDYEAIQSISNKEYDKALELITSDFSDSDGNELPESIVETVLEYIKGE